MLTVFGPSRKAGAVLLARTLPMPTVSSRAVLSVTAAPRMFSSAAAGEGGAADSGRENKPPAADGAEIQRRRLEYYNRQEQRLQSTFNRMRSTAGTMTGGFGGSASTPSLSRRPATPEQLYGGGARVGGFGGGDTTDRVAAAMEYKRAMAERRAQDEAIVKKEIAEEAAREAERKSSLFGRAADAAAAVAADAEDDGLGGKKSWFKKFFK